MRCMICKGSTPGGNDHFIVDEHGESVGVLCDECASRRPSYDLGEEATWYDAWNSLYYHRPAADLTQIQRAVLIVPATVARFVALIFTLGAAAALFVYILLALVWAIIKDKLTSPLPGDVAEVRRMMHRGPRGVGNDD